LLIVHEIPERGPEEAPEEAQFDALKERKVGTGKGGMIQLNPAQLHHPQQTPNSPTPSKSSSYQLSEPL